MSEKQMKGVISRWALINGRIVGTCVLHLEPGHRPGIMTSEVETIMRDEVLGCLVATTKNSRYVLV